MSLKVFDLQCEHGHVFEGWFASADAYEIQKSRGLLSCPVCNSTSVNRKLTAARLNVGHLKRERLEHASQADSAASRSAAVAMQGAEGPVSDLARMQAEMLQHVRKVLRETENVGERFAEESRRIHYGESEKRAIRGVATIEECHELAEEGISVVPIPDFFDDDRLQ